MNVSQLHLENWGKLSNEELKRQYLFIMRWARKEDFVFTIERLMNERRLKIFTNEVLEVEFEKALKGPYHSHKRLLDRVQNALYGEK